MATRRTTPLQSTARAARGTKAPTAKRYKPTPAETSDKEHLVSVIQEATGSTKKAAKEALDAVLGTVTATLKKNQKLQLTGFGSFNVVARAARKGVNPRTGEPVRIKRSKTVRFKPGQTLKGAI